VTADRMTLLDMEWSA